MSAFTSQENDTIVELSVVRNRNVGEDFVVVDSCNNEVAKRGMVYSVSKGATEARRRGLLVVFDDLTYRSYFGVWHAATCMRLAIAEGATGQRALNLVSSHEVFIYTFLSIKRAV